MTIVQNMILIIRQYASVNIFLLLRANSKAIAISVFHIVLSL